MNCAAGRTFSGFNFKNFQEWGCFFQWQYLYINDIFMHHKNNLLIIISTVVLVILQSFSFNLARQMGMHAWDVITGGGVNFPPRYLSSRNSSLVLMFKGGSTPGPYWLREGDPATAGEYSKIGVHGDKQRWLLGELKIKN